MHRRSVFAKRRLSVGHERQRVVLHLKEAHGLLGQVLIVRCYRRNLVAHEPDHGIQNRHVRRDPALRSVEGSKHRVNARHAHYAAHVDGDYPSVWVRAAQHLGVQHPRQLDVRRETGLAGKLLRQV